MLDISRKLECTSPLLLPFLLNVLSPVFFLYVSDGAPNAHKHQRWNFASLSSCLALDISSPILSHQKVSDPCDPNVLLFPSQCLSAGVITTVGKRGDALKRRKGIGQSRGGMKRMLEREISGESRGVM